MHAMPARGFNDPGCKEKLQEFLRVALEHNPVNTGEGKVGNQFVRDRSEIHDRASSIMHAVFTQADDVAEVLRELKEEEIGISITASGIFETLFECCKKAGIKPHALEYSLGVLGKTEALPETEIGQVTTMCGHAQISQGLVRRMIRKVKCGDLSAREAAVEMAKQCQCGVFNPVRAEQLLEEYCALYCVAVT